MLYLILASGFILRLFSLKSHDFWFDEAITYHFARLPIPDLLKVVSTDNNPPLYYLLMHFVAKISTNEIFLRLPSLVASLLTIYLIYKIANKRNRTVALFAAGLYSTSPLAVYIATEARLHSLGAFFVISLTSAYLSVIKKPKLKEISAFIAISIPALYTQYYVALLFVPMTLILIFQKHEITFKKWLLLAGFCFLTLAPWLIFSLRTSHNGCWCPNTLLSLPAALISPALNGVGIVTLRSFLSLNLLIVTLFTLTALVTLVFFLKGLSSAGKVSVLYVIPLIILSILGLFFPYFSPKGFSIFSPLYFLITAWGVSKQKNYHKYFLILMSLLAIVSTIQIINPFFHGENLKKIAMTLETDPKIPAVHTSLATYYSLNFYNGALQQQMLLTKNPLNFKTLEYINPKQERGDQRLENIWFIDYPKWVDTDSYQKGRSWILFNYKIKRSYFVDNIKFYLMEK